ncbi:YafY family transcriptional regulator [Acidobacteria bacterium AB60]|nr:YafY family transcriptional regulator [Acidobacteria bacterium AB60]
MKADRLLSVLLLLQARGRATERELAERLEVSQRTIHRDLEALSAANVPVVALRGSQGGWELAEGWRTQVPALEANELRALVMAQPRALGHPRLRAAAESALNKLMAALPGSMREEAAVMRERIHVDPTGWWEAGEDVSGLPLVQDAVMRDKKLTFDYIRADGEASARTVDPLGLVAKGSTWYLIARTPNGMRTFRLSRMSGVTVLATGFKRPARFDLNEHWKQSTTELEGKRRGYPVELAVQEGAAKWLRGWLRATPSGAGQAVPGEGWTAMRVEFEDLGQARFMVLGLGSRARVIAPPELRKAVAEEIGGMLAQMSRES